MGFTFYRCDDDGNQLKDENGKVITYRAETNCEYLAEGLDVEDLEENEDEDILSESDFSQIRRTKISCRGDRR